MHALKKAGLTVVTGSLIGAFATVATADNNTLMNVGDYGSFSSAAPNGNADQVWATDTDGTDNGVLIRYGYRSVRGAPRVMVSVVVDTAGSGYGQEYYCWWRNLQQRWLRYTCRRYRCLNRLVGSCQCEQHWIRWTERMPLPTRSTVLPAVL